MARGPKQDYNEALIPQVIKMLEDGATKKAACETLGIAYNTKRLADIIEKYQSDKEESALRRKQKRGTPIQGVELENIIEGYLVLDLSFDHLSKRFYRPVEAIRMALWRCGALLKTTEKANPLWPSQMPDECYKHGEADEFSVGQLVWVAGYGCLGEIRKYHGNGQYRVYLMDRDLHRNVNFNWWDLGDLSHLEKLGVNLRQLGGVMDADEIKEILYETMRKARMTANRRD